jgi:hypothetical protein
MRELVDRLDGRPLQSIDCHDVVIAAELSDAELSCDRGRRRG